jgi:flagellar protein FliS
MRVNFKAMASYGADNFASQASVANGVVLIQMLFDGLIDSLVAAQGHLQHGAIAEKGVAISRASRIVVGLQGSLDFEKGGDLAQNLNELYSYVTRRLIYANAYNDAGCLQEVQGLMDEIRQAWREVPSLSRAQAPARASPQISVAMY